MYVNLIKHSWYMCLWERMANKKTTKTTLGIKCECQVKKIERKKKRAYVDILYYIN
jgi:hypothetical protein